MELREFGIRDICYVNYRYMVVGEIAISLPIQSCSKGMVSYPELTYFFMHLPVIHISV